MEKENNTRKLEYDGLQLSVTGIEAVEPFLKVSKPKLTLGQSDYGWDM